MGQVLCYNQINRKLCREMYIMQNVSSPFLAHISEDGLRTQTVAEHLQGTAALCSRFAAAFDAAEYGNLAGLLHDIGKYSTAFQNRLHGGPRVDHSTAGAQEALKRRWPELAFAVAGHHSGLPDGGTPLDLPQQSTLMGRNKKRTLPPINPGSRKSPCRRWPCADVFPAHTAKAFLSACCIPALWMPTILIPKPL